MFDLIESQKTVRETKSQRDLYMILEDISRKREAREITKHEYEEMSDLIKQRMREVSEEKAC